MSGAGGGTGGGSGRSGAGGTLPGEVFREVTPAPVWLRMIGVLVLVAAVLLAADALLIDPRSFAGGGAVVAVVATVVLVAVGVLLLVVRMQVTVTGASTSAADTAADGDLTLALLPVWRVRIPLTDVVGGPADPGGAGSPTMRDVTLREFGGVGYRALPGNRRALLLSSGRAVVVSRLSSGLSYTVRTDHSVELVRAVTGAPVG